MVALGAAPAVLGSQACSAPSTEVDGGDLMGVFDHRDASADGKAPDGGKRRGKKDAGASPAASAEDPSGLADASLRPAVEGVCVAEQGTPNRDTRRTLGRPACRGAQVLEWKDSEGSPRYACVFAPPGVETRAPLPLVVFFHDPQDDPTAVDKKTAFRKALGSYSVNKDPAHTGFVILAVQGRALSGGSRGNRYDVDYTGPDNVDVATTDHFVAELDQKGLVDRRRIYTLGASAGGHMAATYAMTRPDKVAAFATYGTDAPPATWSCPGPPPPGLVAYRACDGVISCESVERWLRARDQVSAETAWMRLGSANDDEPACATRNKCTPKRAEGNHHRWPKGKEDVFLSFFSKHTLGPGPGAGAPGPAAPAGEPAVDPPAP